MLTYSLNNGKSLENAQIEILEQERSEYSTDQLLNVYNYLLEVIKPMNPKTIFLLQEDEKRGVFWKFLGPLPIVRQFMAIATLSLIALIVTSLSEEVNVNSIQLSMLQGFGWNQVYRLTFLLSCASVGSSFYALFKINSYLAKQTFDAGSSYIYWSRFVLGLVSGLLLSELFVSIVEPMQHGVSTVGNDHSVDSLSFLLKPVLAIIGGFSADLVYRILNKLVDTVESLFKGDMDDIVAQKEQHFELKAQEQNRKLKIQVAQQLLKVKQLIVNENVSNEVIEEVDRTLDKVINNGFGVENLTKPIDPMDSLGN